MILPLRFRRLVASNSCWRHLARACTSVAVQHDNHHVSVIITSGVAQQLWRTSAEVEPTKASLYAPCRAPASFCTRANS